ncbi:MAG TPA: purine-nucleoside phosphorylase, partial [Candidatus Baltobacteraceae bacterium]
NLAGAKTLILTNAAGALNPAFAPGQLMLIEDHINLTGANPLVASGLENPFVDMARCYSPRLRHIARDVPGGDALVEGVYLALLGPSYETAAEGRYLRGVGADAVGMSTVLETILARSKAMEVLGISLITNAVGAEETTHAEVTAVAKSAATRLSAIIAGVLEKM